MIFSKRSRVWTRSAGLSRAGPPVTVPLRGPWAAETEAEQGFEDRETSVALREAYVGTFDVAGQSVVSALRMFLGAFRLPGDPGGPEGHRTRRSLASRLLLLFDKPDEAKL